MSSPIPKSPTSDFSDFEIPLIPKSPTSDASSIIMPFGSSIPPVPKSDIPLTLPIFRPQIKPVLPLNFDLLEEYLVNIRQKAEITRIEYIGNCCEPTLVRLVRQFILVHLKNPYLTLSNNQSYVIPFYKSTGTSDSYTERKDTWFPHNGWIYDRQLDTKIGFVINKGTESVASKDNKKLIDELIETNTINSSVLHRFSDDITLMISAILGNGLWNTIPMIRSKMLNKVVEEYNIPEPIDVPMEYINDKIGNNNLIGINFNEVAKVSNLKFQIVNHPFFPSYEFDKLVRYSISFYQQDRFYNIFNKNVPIIRDLYIFRHLTLEKRTELEQNLSKLLESFNSLKSADENFKLEEQIEETFNYRRQIGGMFDKNKYFELFNNIQKINNNEQFKDNVFNITMEYATKKSKNNIFWSRWYQKNNSIDSIFKINRSYLFSGGVVNKILNYLIDMPIITNFQISTMFHQYQILKIINYYLDSKNKISELQLKDLFVNKINKETNTLFNQACSKYNDFTEIQFCIRRFFTSIDNDIDEISNKNDKLMLKDLIKNIKQSILDPYVKKDCGQVNRPSYCEKLGPNTIIRLNLQNFTNK